MITAKVTISVTQEHIDKGCRYGCFDCPIALALYDVVKPDTYIEVDTEYISFGKQKIKLPEAAKLFIDRFDSSGKNYVSPFSFVLDI